VQVRRQCRSTSKRALSLLRVLGDRVLVGGFCFLHFVGGPVRKLCAALPAGWWCWADALVYQQAVVGESYPFKYNLPGIGAPCVGASAPLQGFEGCRC
jgi:hypothetical protein